MLKADDIREPLEMRIDSLENFDPTASLEGLPKGANLRLEEKKNLPSAKF